MRKQDGIAWLLLKKSNKRITELQSVLQEFLNVMDVEELYTGKSACCDKSCQHHVCEVVRRARKLLKTKEVR